MGLLVQKLLLNFVVERKFLFLIFSFLLISNISSTFLIHSHLVRSGHIGHLVIASEEAISKGVRRIVALTGPEAQKALNKSAVLENALNALRNELKTIPLTPQSAKEMVKRIVELTNDVSHAVIPYWKKVKLFYFITFFF